ncbi:MAG: hypothetical protein ACK41U_17030 [Paracoccus sp. (in: a-proteobacteria)]|uniref:hypothetical protein n=1 Tax=Paracoccus sp. TaxID=267 RepID=UPI00391C39E1
MTNNILTGPDAQARFVLQTLRAQDNSGTIGPGDNPLGESAFLSLDPEAAVKGQFQSVPGEIISLSMRPATGQTPRWQGYHIPLGPFDMSDAGVFGVVARSTAPASITTRICLRSGRDGQFTDKFLPKTMVSFSQSSTHLDLLDLSTVPDVPRQADWRDLILFFRPGPVEITLQDLRLFLV